MNDQPIGITFKETMQGCFLLGQSSPRAAERRGAIAGMSLAMHNIVTIRDLQRFIDDPEHLAQLDGEIDFYPVGLGMRADQGTFNLFSPTDDLNLRLMIYKLPFHHQGKGYELVGRKFVRNDPGFDLFSDTTTLLTRLYRGDEASGEIVGAGVLQVGVLGLLRMVAGMEVTGATNLKEKAQALEAFGRLFAGELWDVYAPGRRLRLLRHAGRRARRPAAALVPRRLRPSSMPPSQRGRRHAG